MEQNRMKLNVRLIRIRVAVCVGVVLLTPLAFIVGRGKVCAESWVSCGMI